MREAVLPKLSPIHCEYVQSVKTEDNVDVLREDVCKARYALKKAPPLLLPLFLLNLCRTITKQDGAARESTTLVISLRLLVLLDYLLHNLQHKSPYWSTAFYEKQFDPKLSTVFLQHCKDNHRKTRNEFEGVTLLLILP